MSTAAAASFVAPSDFLYLYHEIWGGAAPFSLHGELQVQHVVRDGQRLVGRARMVGSFPLRARGQDEQTIEARLEYDVKPMNASAGAVDRWYLHVSSGGGGNGVLLGTSSGAHACSALLAPSKFYVQDLEVSLEHTGTLWAALMLYSPRIELGAGGNAHLEDVRVRLRVGVDGRTRRLKNLSSVTASGRFLGAEASIKVDRSVLKLDVDVDLSRVLHDLLGSGVRSVELPSLFDEDTISAVGSFSWELVLSGSGLPSARSGSFIVRISPSSILESFGLAGLADGVLGWGEDDCELRLSWTDDIDDWSLTISIPSLTNPLDIQSQSVMSMRLTAIHELLNSLCGQRGAIASLAELLARGSRGVDWVVTITKQESALVFQVELERSAQESLSLPSLSSSPFSLSRMNISVRAQLDEGQAELLHAEALLVGVPCANKGSIALRFSAQDNTSSKQLRVSLTTSASDGVDIVGALDRLNGGAFSFLSSGANQHVVQKHTRRSGVRITKLDVVLDAEPDSDVGLHSLLLETADFRLDWRRAHDLITVTLLCNQKPMDYFPKCLRDARVLDGLGIDKGSRAAVVTSDSPNDDETKQQLWDCYREGAGLLPASEEYADLLASARRHLHWNVSEQTIKESKSFVSWKATIDIDRLLSNRIMSFLLGRSKSSLGRVVAHGEILPDGNRACVLAEHRDTRSLLFATYCEDEKLARSGIVVQLGSGRKSFKLSDVLWLDDLELVYVPDGPSESRYCRGKMTLKLGEDKGKGKGKGKDIRFSTAAKIPLGGDSGGDSKLDASMEVVHWKGRQSLAGIMDFVALDGTIALGLLPELSFDMHLTATIEGKTILNLFSLPDRFNFTVGGSWHASNGASVRVYVSFQITEPGSTWRPFAKGFAKNLLGHLCVLTGTGACLELELPQCTWSGVMRLVLEFPDSGNTLDVTCGIAQPAIDSFVVAIAPKALLLSDLLSLLPLVRKLPLKWVDWIFGMQGLYLQAGRVPQDCKIALPKAPDGNEMSPSDALVLNVGKMWAFGGLLEGENIKVRVGKKVFVVGGKLKCNLLNVVVMSLEVDVDAQEDSLKMAFRGTVQILPALPLVDATTHGIINDDGVELGVTISLFGLIDLGGTLRLSRSLPYPELGVVLDTEKLTKQITEAAEECGSVVGFLAKNLIPAVHLEFSTCLNPARLKLFFLLKFELLGKWWEISFDIGNTMDSLWDLLVRIMKSNCVAEFLGKLDKALREILVVGDVYEAVEHVINAIGDALGCSGLGFGGGKGKGKGKRKGKRKGKGKSGGKGGGTSGSGGGPGGAGSSAAAAGGGGGGGSTSGSGGSTGRDPPSESKKAVSARAAASHLEGQVKKKQKALASTWGPKVGNIANAMTGALEAALNDPRGEPFDSEAVKNSMYDAFIGAIPPKCEECSSNKPELIYFDASGGDPSFYCAPCTYQPGTEEVKEVLHWMSCDEDLACGRHCRLTMRHVRRGEPHDCRASVVAKNCYCGKDQEVQPCDHRQSDGSVELFGCGEVCGAPLSGGYCPHGQTCKKGCHPGECQGSCSEEVEVSCFLHDKREHRKCSTIAPSEYALSLAEDHPPRVFGCGEGECVSDTKDKDEEKDKGKPEDKPEDQPEDKLEDKPEETRPDVELDEDDEHKTDEDIDDDDGANAPCFCGKRYSRHYGARISCGQICGRRVCRSGRTTNGHTAVCKRVCHEDVCTCEAVIAERRCHCGAQHDMVLCSAGYDSEEAAVTGCWGGVTKFSCGKRDCRPPRSDAPSMFGFGQSSAEPQPQPPPPPRPPSSSPQSQPEPEPELPDKPVLLRRQSSNLPAALESVKEAPSVYRQLATGSTVSCEPLSLSNAQIPQTLAERCKNRTALTKVVMLQAVSASNPEAALATVETAMDHLERLENMAFRKRSTGLVNKVVAAMLKRSEDNPERLEDCFTDLCRAFAAVDLQYLQQQLEELEEKFPGTQDRGKSKESRRSKASKKKKRSKKLGDSIASVEGLTLSDDVVAALPESLALPKLLFLEMLVSAQLPSYELAYNKPSSRLRPIELVVHARALSEDRKHKTLAIIVHLLEYAISSKRRFCVITCNDVSSSADGPPATAHALKPHGRSSVDGKALLHLLLASAKTYAQSKLDQALTHLNKLKLGAGSEASTTYVLTAGGLPARFSSSVCRHVASLRKRGRLFIGLALDRADRGAMVDLLGHDHVLLLRMGQPDDTDCDDHDDEEKEESDESDVEDRDESEQDTPKPSISDDEGDCFQLLQQFKKPRSVAVDEENGLVYVGFSDLAPPSILVLELKTGHAVHMLTGLSKTPSAIFGIALSPDGSTLFATARNSRTLLEVSLEKGDGTVRKRRAKERELPEDFTEPCGLAVLGDELYVACKGGARLAVFSTDNLEYKRDDPRLRGYQCHDVCFSEDGTMYVSLATGQLQPGHTQPPSSTRAVWRLDPLRTASREHTVCDQTGAFGVSLFAESGHRHHIAIGNSDSKKDGVHVRSQNGTDLCNPVHECGRVYAVCCVGHSDIIYTNGPRVFRVSFNDGRMTKIWNFDTSSARNE